MGSSRKALGEMEDITNKDAVPITGVMPKRAIKMRLQGLIDELEGQRAA